MHHKLRRAARRGGMSCLAGGRGISCHSVRSADQREASYAKHTVSSPTFDWNGAEIVDHVGSFPECISRTLNIRI